MKKLLTLALTLGLLTSCGNPHELVYKSGEMTQTLAEGQTALPEEFKAYIFPGATTAGSVSAEGDNSEESKFLMLSCKNSADVVSKWYQDKLKANNWKMVTVAGNSPPKIISLVGHKDNTEFNIMIAEDTDKTSISLSLANQVEDNSNVDENNQNFVPDKANPATE